MGPGVNHARILRSGLAEIPAHDGDDVYCDVALRDISALDVVVETDDVLAYHHTRPFWPVHIVVVPKVDVSSLSTLTAADEPVVRALLAVVQAVARSVEAAERAAAVLTNLASYQDSQHLHVPVSSGAALR